MLRLNEEFFEVYYLIAFSFFWLLLLVYSEWFFWCLVPGGKQIPTPVSISFISAAGIIPPRWQVRSSCPFLRRFMILGNTVMCARQDTHTNHINIFLQCRIHHHFRCLTQTGIDHFPFRHRVKDAITFGTTIMAIKADFGNQYCMGLDIGSGLLRHWISCIRIQDIYSCRLSFIWCANWWPVLFRLIFLQYNRRSVKIKSPQFTSPGIKFWKWLDGI